ncbi:MAG: hypothetical protein F4046_08475 [Acidimicrobiaceae bacterium]|nr:hypothetical protein [Acidimicrobiaceae bacterium]MYJ81836.1 hypothetical protein [Acidimicrobiaceae bacterium]
MAADQSALALRTEVRQFLAEYFTGEMIAATRDGVIHSPRSAPGHVWACPVHAERAWGAMPLHG